MDYLRITRDCIWRCFSLDYKKCNPLARRLHFMYSETFVGYFNNKPRSFRDCIGMPSIGCKGEAGMTHAHVFATRHRRRVEGR